MRNKYFYPIFKLKAKSWIRYWLLKKTEFKGKLSEILTGFSFNLENTLNRKFKIFEILGNSVQDGEPTPSTPIEIKSAGDNGSITERIVSKNFLEITEDTRLTHCTYVSGANTNEYKLLCTNPDMYVNEIRVEGSQWTKEKNGNLIPCKYGETIYYDTGNTLFNGCYFSEFDENLISLGYYFKRVSNGTYTPTNANCKYVTFRFGYGVNAQAGTTYTLAPIVSKTPIDSYIAHKEQTYTIPTQQPMRSIGDVRDVFFKNTVDSPYYDENLTLNGWYERHYINRVILDGTEDNWDIAIAANMRAFLLNNYILTSNLTAMSNYYKNRATNDWTSLQKNEFICGRNNNQLIIRNDDYTTTADFKAMLAEKYASGNPVYVDYLSQEPLNLPCTQAQIDILENLPKSYAGQTNVFSEDEVKAYLKIQYWESDTNG